MRVIPPVEITDTRLVSTTVSEPGVGEANWSSGTTYALGDVVIVGSPTATVTISVASPGVVSWSDHGLAAGTPIVLTTTGALPTGLTAGARYYVVSPAEDTFQLSTSPGGGPIVTTGTQSGTHTATAEVHRKFESLEAANHNHSPMTNSDKWLDIGPTNAWAMFDLLRNTATYAASPLTVEIAPGQRCNSIALVGLVADEVTVTVSVGGSPIYTVTETLRTRVVTGWYSYYYAPFTLKPSFLRLDIPPVTNAVFEITLTRSSGDAACGGVIIGTSVYLGETSMEPTDDAENFSKIEFNDYGDAVLVKRRVAPRVSMRARCSKADLVRGRDVRKSLTATPALWLGLDDDTDGFFESVQVLGVYTSFSYSLDEPEYSTLNIEVMEI